MIPRYVTVSKENLAELEKAILDYKKLGFKIYGEPKKAGKYYIQIMHNFPNQ